MAKKITLCDKTLVRKIEIRNQRKNPTRVRIYIPKYKSIMCIDILTGEIYEIESFKKVALLLNAKEKNVQECLATWRGTGAKAVVRSIKDKMLIYKENFNSSIDYVQRYNDIIAESHKTTGRKTSILRSSGVLVMKNSKGVRAKYIPTGQEYEFPSIRSMSRELHLEISLVRKCLKEEGKQYKGYTFELLNNNPYL